MSALPTAALVEIVAIGDVQIVFPEKPQGDPDSPGKPGPAAQVSVAQTPASQIRLAQSAPAAQVVPRPHSPQVPPPQSTPVSLPFFTPSVQDGVAHEPVSPLATQMPLAQSPAAQHLRPLAQAEQRPPPQSVSLSTSLRTPSAHVAILQSPLGFTTLGPELASPADPVFTQVSAIARYQYRDPAGGMSARRPPVVVDEYVPSRHESTDGLISAGSVAVVPR